MNSDYVASANCLTLYKFLESEKIIIGSVESEKTGSLESKISGPYRAPNIFLKKKPALSALIGVVEQIHC